MKWLEIVKSHYKIIILLGIIIWIYIFYNSSKKIDLNIVNKGKFTIGTFKEFTYSIGHGGGHHLEYSYYDEDGKYHSDSNVPIFPNKEQRKIISKGDQFLVVYNSDGSMIFFDRPIKDSADFERYVKEFEELRRQQKK